MNQGCPGLGLGRATSWACAVATSPCHISPCHTLAHLILSPCHFMSPCHVLSLSHLMSPCHSSFCHPHLVTLSSHPVTLTYVTPSHLILSPCHISCNLSHPVTLSHLMSLSPSHLVTLSPPVTLSHVTPSHLILSPSSHHLVISSCHPVTSHVTLSFHVILSHPVTLSPQVVVTSHPVTSSHLVTSPCHISCQISSCHTSCHPSHLIMSPRHICSVCRSLPGDAAPPTGEASPCRAPASSLIRGPRLSGVGRGEVEPIHSLTPT